MSKSLHRLALALFTLPWVLGACSGGCDALQPLPAPVPQDQTIEGGVQVRVTPTGFDKLTAILPGMLNDAIEGGFCVGELGPVGIGVADVSACDSGACAGGATGCPVTVSLDALDMSIPDTDTFRIDATFDVSVPVHVRADWIIGGDSTCTLTVTLNNGRVIADIGFGIDPADGELEIHLEGIDTFDISNLGISGCGVLGDILDGVIGFVADVMSSAIGTFIIDALAPVIDGFLQDMLPDPLGLEGMLDLGGMMSGIAPGVNATLETKAVAGGYVSLPAQGLSVGMIVGLNADQNTGTRDPANDNEAAFCVPNRPAPDFAAPPASLPMTPRGTFALQPAGEFLGQPDPAADVALGVSETVLDLAGHHIVNSGGMCLGVGSSTVPQLNLGTIGILVPSLSELGAGTGKEPLLLVLRPQQPLDFTVGDNTDTSPRLTINIKDLDVDFYAFLYERYIRAFTITLNLNVGINLDFVLDDMGQPALLPTIVGLDSETIDVEVSNNDFLHESADELEQVFPTVFDLVLPLLSEGLGPIALPEVAGFSMENLTVGRVTTTEDDFLAIYATLAPTPGMMPRIVKSQPFSRMARELAPATGYESVETHARLVRVTTPPPALVRNHYTGHGEGAVTQIELELGGTSPDGLPLEWQWNLDGGMWRPYDAASNPVLTDDAFTVQGRHTLYVRARAIGDYRTFDPTPVAIPVEIDSVGPEIVGSRLEGGHVTFEGFDLVAEAHELEWSFGGGAFTKDARLSLEALAELAGAGGTVDVRARDTAGNVTRTAVNVDSLIVGFHGRAPAGDGCDCHVGAAPHDHGERGATILGALLVFAFALRRQLRRGFAFVAKRAGLFALALIALAAPGCNCGGEPPGEGPSCEVDEDCADLCPEGEVGLCLQNECVCTPDILYGDIGMYSDLAASPLGGAWVSAYNSEHGDLVVARVTASGRIPNELYIFVDGVPDGPVVLPTSDVRGGIKAKGDDVGLYTSIDVGDDDRPWVSYFDFTHGSLKVAHYDGELWQVQTVDAGDPGIEEVGRYSTITVGPDGRPAVAYYATITEGPEVGHTEVRFAQANTANPSSPGDWSLFIVDDAALPPPPPEDAPADLPEGVGLFISSARLTNGAPVLAYYDRPNGDLRMAVFNAANGVFDDPVVVDGADGSDVGLYPSVSVAPDDTIHLSYVDATRDNLIYLPIATATPEIVDDGFRIDGNTMDGLPLPVYHFVGDDSALITSGFIGVVYQDATTHELLYSVKQPDGTWSRTSVAGGDENPWRGGFGFYAAADLEGDDVIMSSYVVDQQAFDSWVEIFRLPGVEE